MIKIVNQINLTKVWKKGGKKFRFDYGLVGFTLVEVLLVAGLFGILLSITVVISNGLVNSYYSVLNLSNSASRARFALSIVDSDLREARESEQGEYPIDTAADDELVFFADVDDDGEVERVRYWLDGDEFKRGVIQPESLPDVYPSESEVERVMSEKIVNGANPIFYYFNQDWPEDDLNNPLVLGERLLHTRTIKILLQVDETGGVSERTVDSFSTVRLRNIGE